MTLANKALVAALVAAAIPLASPVAAAPLSQSLALNNADVGAVEHVQYRRWNRGYGGGYYAYGAAPDGYYAYGAAPGYVVGPGRFSTWSIYGNGSAAAGPGSAPYCSSDREDNSAFPSWACR